MLRAFKGRSPQVDSTAFVSEAAYVVGDVEVGPEASIWPAAVVRSSGGKIEVGAGTNIQDGSICESDGGMTIGRDVSLGHLVSFYGKSIGDNCLIGNHARIERNAEIGQWCIVAAGAVVPEGARVPDNTIAKGSPAEYAPLSPHHYDAIRETAEYSRALAREYKTEGGLE